MTTDEIKALIRQSIQIGRKSMVEDLWEVDALSQGNGWDEELMYASISAVAPALVEKAYAGMDLNRRSGESRST